MSMFVGVLLNERAIDIIDKFKQDFIEEELDDSDVVTVALILLENLSNSSMSFVVKGCVKDFIDEYKDSSDVRNSTLES